MTHRHATDRKKVVVVAGCPNGCQSFEVETEGRNESVDELLETVRKVFGDCSKCGESIGSLAKSEPSEVLQ